MDEEHEDVWRYNEARSFSGFFNPFDNGVWSYVRPAPFQTRYLGIAFTDWKEKVIWAFKPNTGTEEEEVKFK
jgi:hypothetical protein